MKLHRRRWHGDKTWCGRPVRKRQKLAKATTPPELVCRRCAELEEKDDREFVRLATLINEALWRSGQKLL